ncbi:hypothetical protein FB451DRAFT_1168368 [Mycena latifolia]|nr:hypothetical protein FB451DRAFT_1168368 [Mycena latifolia]
MSQHGGCKAVKPITGGKSHPRIVEEKGGRQETTARAAQIRWDQLCHPGSAALPPVFNLRRRRIQPNTHWDLSGTCKTGRCVYCRRCSPRLPAALHSGIQPVKQPARRRVRRADAVHQAEPARRGGAAPRGAPAGRFAQGHRSPCTQRALHTRAPWHRPTDGRGLTAVLTAVLGTCANQPRSTFLPYTPRPRPPPGIFGAIAIYRGVTMIPALRYCAGVENDSSCRRGSSDANQCSDETRQAHATGGWAILLGKHHRFKNDAARELLDVALWQSTRREESANNTNDTPMTFPLIPSNFQRQLIIIARVEGRTLKVLFARWLEALGVECARDLASSSGDAAVHSGENQLIEPGVKDEAYGLLAREWRGGSIGGGGQGRDAGDSDRSNEVE